jgi:hypothetical protein
VARPLPDDVHSIHANNRMIQRLSVALLLSVSVLGGCSGEKKASAAQPAPIKEGNVAPRQAVVTVPTEAYRPVQVSGGGTLTGTVDYEGTVPTDSVLTVPADQQIGCGQTVTDKAVNMSGTRVAGVIVWITDIRSGKPLPVARRFELVNSDCLLDPRVQAVLAPGALNVTSEDVALHRDKIVNVGTGEMVGIAPFNDNGEVVPFDHLLDKPAELEINCELHPWSKAYVLVFDHPYFATTAAGGTFSIDDVPPGTYHVRAWHPALGLSDQTVTITAGQISSLALKLKGSGAALPAPPDSQ